MLLPNQLTVLRIVLTPVFLFLFLSEDQTMQQISVAVFIIAALTDWYDGWLARKFDYITEWGKFLDPLADKILTLTAFFAFVVLDVLELWMVIIIALRDVVITLLRLYADYTKKSITTSKSAKWKTFFQMAFLYYLITIYALHTIPFIYNGREQLFNNLLYSPIIYFVMLFVTLLTFFTGANYLVKNKLLIKQLFSFETKSD